MLKKISVIINVILFLCCIILIDNNSKLEDTYHEKTGLKIGKWSTGVGSVNEANTEKTSFTYTLTLLNESESNITIKSVEPIIDESIKSKISNKDINLMINKELHPNDSIEVTGNLIIDFGDATKSEINKLYPFFHDVRINSEQDLPIFK